jgi:transposase
MAKTRVTGRLGNAIAPLLPEPTPSPKGGRPPVPHRACLEGIIFVLKTGMPWQMLPTELGVRQRQHLLAAVPRLDAVGGLARTAPTAGARARPTRSDQPGTCGHRQRLDVGAQRGAHAGPNPTDHGKNGCKRHRVTDAEGIPLVVRTGPANQPDAELALEMLDAIPPGSGPKGRPRRRPKAFQGDGAYGIKALIAAVVQRRVGSLLAPYGKARKEHGSGLGKIRSVVERSLSWMGTFRRLKLCYERFGEHFQAFHEMAACLICANRIERFDRVDSGF